MSIQRGGALTHPTSAMHACTVVSRLTVSIQRGGGSDDSLPMLCMHALSSRERRMGPPCAMSREL